ncbi:MAG: hypothetical protein NVSMB47_14230 [Polyangiales bacterium]
MPVTLLVRANAGEPALAPLALDAPRIVLGRGDGCDVRLPEASVSARHCSIRAANAGYVVVDEGSTNGTRLNGEKLATQAPRLLRTGDVLQLGRVHIDVRIGAAVPSSAQATRELALALVARRLSDPAAAQLHVRVVEGVDVGRSVALVAGAPRTIGRDPRCALRLTDRGIPPIALEVVLDGARVRVVRKDERVPATLAGKTLEIGVGAMWSDRAQLRIASTTVQLDDPLARALDESAHGDDEKLATPSLPPPADPLPPEPAPPPPPSAADVVDAQPVGDPERVVVRPPSYDRRRSWRGATLAFELVALVVALLVLAGSAAGLWWLLRK